MWWDGASCQGTRAALNYCFQVRFHFQQPYSFLTMSQSEPIPFRCPGCEAEFGAPQQCVEPLEFTLDGDDPVQ
jgi:hypothetical protein